MQPKKEVSLWGFGITIAALVLVAIFVDITSVKDWVGRAGVWGPLVFIILKASTHIIMPLSGSPLYPIVGLLFGFWPGIMYTVMGDMIGVTTNFFLSRKFGKRLISRWIPDNEESLLNRIINYMDDAKGFFHTALTFFATPELLSYAAGLSRLPYIKFILIITPIGAVSTSALVLFGSFFGAESQSLWVTFSIPILATLAVLVGGSLFMRGMRKKS